MARTAGLPRPGEREQRHAVHHAAPHHQGDPRQVPGVGVGYHRHQHLLLVSGGKILGKCPLTDLTTVSGSKSDTRVEQPRKLAVLQKRATACH